LAAMLKPRLTTLASAHSLIGENAPPRVQVAAEPGNMRGPGRWRWDLNPRTGEISPITDMNPKTSEKSPSWGSHAVSIAGASQTASSPVSPSAVSGGVRDSGARGLVGAQAARSSAWFSR
jgi:hypothetical protein